MPQSEDNVHAGHRDRLRKRFLEEGLDAFKPHEILELLLFYTIPRKDTNELAHRLLNHFHCSFPAVMEASYEELMEVKGISSNSACLIKLLLPVFRYYEIERAKLNASVLDTPRRRKAYAEVLFQGCVHERLYCICLSPAKKVLRTLLLGEGSFNSVTVPAIKVISQVAAQHADAVILAHNHPNGVAVFSTEDYEYTIYLKKALDTIDVKIDDHVLVTENECWCLMDLGDVDQLLKLHEKNFTSGEM